MSVREIPPTVSNSDTVHKDTPTLDGSIDLTVLVLADGFRPDMLQTLCKSGNLPNITRHLMSEGSYYEGVSVLPSVTNSAYLPMLTGQYPGTADMPGLRWVDKSRFNTGNFLVTGHRSYVGTSHLRFNGDLPNCLETLFELCPDSLAVRSDIHRGLTHGRNIFHRMSIPFMFFSHYLKRSDFIDKIVSTSLLRRLKSIENGKMPRFIFFPLLDVDTTSHAYGPQHQSTVEAYQRVDTLIGTIIAHLKSVGVWNKTHFILSSDHGHTLTTKHLDLSGLISKLGYSVFEHPNIYRRSVNAAVMISGNSFANIYVPSEGKWDGPIFANELEYEHQQLLDTLSQRPEIEWIAYRRHDRAIKIVTHSGIAHLGREGESYTYVYDGLDPLRLHLTHTTIHKSDALELTMETQFPDALEQIWYLFSSQRTGDIVVTSKPGYDLRDRRELPEHHSSHGSLCREHMMVPIVSNRTLSSERPVRTVDIFPTVIDSLGLTPSKPHFGHSLW